MPLKIGTKVRVRPEVITKDFKEAEGIVTHYKEYRHYTVSVKFPFENDVVGFDENELEVIEDAGNSPNPSNSL